MRLPDDYTIIRANDRGRAVKNVQGTQGAHRLLKIQIYLTILLTSVFYASFERIGAYSAVLGGVVYIVPQTCFAYIMFWDSRPFSKHFLRRVYRGEAVKITVSILCFTVTFCFLKIMPWVFFCVYFLVQLTAWITPWVFMTRECAK